MSKRKFEMMSFHDGSTTTDYVAPMSQCPSVEEFVKAVYVEFEAEINPEIVTIDYVRYYPKSPEGLSREFPDGCYTFCQPRRGAIKVYRADVREKRKVASTP